jgi:hypothetical protein
MGVPTAPLTGEIWQVLVLKMKEAGRLGVIAQLVIAPAVLTTLIGGAFDVIKL